MAVQAQEQFDCQLYANAGKSPWCTQVPVYARAYVKGTQGKCALSGLCAGARVFVHMLGWMPVYSRSSTSVGWHMEQVWCRCVHVLLMECMLCCICVQQLIICLPFADACVVY
jgi:hypothetical protein